MSSPVITKIERQKKARHRVSIYLDGAFAFGVNDEAVYRFGLHKGMEMNEALRAEIEQADQRVQAKLTAERFLAARIRTVKEVRVRLQKDGYLEEIIEETVATLQRIQLLDDRLFAEMFVRDRLKLKPRSLSLLRRELRHRGIADAIADTVLEQEARGVDEDKLAASLADEYVRKHPGLQTEVLKRRLVGFLQRKGFSAQVVFGLLDRFGD